MQRYRLASCMAYFASSFGCFFELLYFGNMWIQGWDCRSRCSYTKRYYAGNSTNGMPKTNGETYLMDTR